jgi:hypothetical protein
MMLLPLDQSIAVADRYVKCNFAVKWSGFATGLVLQVAWP